MPGNGLKPQMHTMPKYKILVVDDNAANADVLVDTFSREYEVSVAMDGESALEIVESNPPHLILLDILMPEMGGYEVCRRLKANLSHRKIPVIFLTEKDEVENETKGLGLGAVDYISKPINIPIVKARVKTHLALYDLNLALEEKVRHRTFELNETRLEIIRQLGRAAEYKDNETGLHVIRMSYYSRLIGLASGMNQIQADILLNAAPMHDIGKIGIPDHILQKPGKLDGDEWRIMEQHPAIGAKIIGKQRSELLKEARVVALTHHEKWNGKGYPKGMKGAEIPLSGRIVAIADVFDAFTSERPYKKAWPVEKALELIREESGRHFCPKLVSSFLKALPEVLKIKNQYSDNQET